MIVIILGTAHQKSIPGKCAPDKSFYEYKYSREIVDIVYHTLKDMGYNVFVDVPQDDMKLPQNKELAERVKIVNNLCQKYKNCIYVSIHVNAAGNGINWMKAGGWCAYTSKGTTKSDKLAECLYKSAEDNLKEYKVILEEGKKKGLYDKAQKYIRTDNSDGDKDYEANFYVLKNTKCPAVLTENLFQDNKTDVEFLSSDAGIHAISRIHIEGILNYLKDN